MIGPRQPVQRGGGIVEAGAGVYLRVVVEPVLMSETPPALAGRNYLKVSYTGRGAYDEVNQPFLDFNKAVIAANGRGGPFVKDEDAARRDKGR